MATSGSSDFEPDVAEYVEEAFERCGLEYRTGYDGVTARRSLNLLFADWANRGLNQWTVTNSTTTLSQGDEFIDLTATTIDVLDVVVRRTDGSNTTDIAMEQIGRSEYWNLPDKSTQSRPTQFFLDKQITPRLYIWPASENSTDQLIINRLVRIEDADAGDNNRSIVALDITSGKHKEVLEAIAGAMNAASAIHKPMVVIADSENSEFIHIHITACVGIDVIDRP